MRIIIDGNDSFVNPSKGMLGIWVDVGGRLTKVRDVQRDLVGAEAFSIADVKELSAIDAQLATDDESQKAWRERLEKSLAQRARWYEEIRAGATLLFDTPSESPRG